MDERTMENEYQWLAICLHEVLLLQHPLYETYDRSKPASPAFERDRMEENT